MNKKRDLNQREYDELMECIISSLMKNGIKSTTMDSIASLRQMSKRTLYEIFESKENMFKEAHSYFHKKMGNSLKEIFCSSENVMEAIIRCFLFNRDLMSNVNVDFIREINQYDCKPDINSENSFRDSHFLHFNDVLKRGVEEGYFNEDINLMVHSRMLGIQMESLKRMEELFPKDISLLEVYDSIIIGFLRGICTEKGRKELDRVIQQLKSETKLDNQD